MKIALAITILGVLIAFALRAEAADRALVLNDQEQAALIHALDLATRSGDTKDARVTVYLLNKLEQAPVVTDKKDDKPETPK